MKKQPSFLSGLRLMMFAEITFCPSINLEQPVNMVLILFLTSSSAKLWNALPDFIRSDGVNWQVFKWESRTHFVLQLFLKISVSLNISYLVFYPYAWVDISSCNWTEIRDERNLRLVCGCVYVLPLAGRVRTLCIARLLCLPYERGN